jgi:N-methylhydantoinase A
MSASRTGGWSLGVDIGGTFTDVVLWSGDQTGASPASHPLIIEKVLTTPDDPARGVLAGVDLALDRARVTADALDSVIHGTTLVANAIIERKGVPTALVTTAGFRDVLEIGREWRYDLFDLDIVIPAPLVPRHRRVELPERVSATGAVLDAPSDADLESVADHLRSLGVPSVAICLLHSYANPIHETRLAAVIRDQLPDVSLSLSSQVSGEIGEYERSSTTTANAYVLPIFEHYVANLVSALHQRGYRRELLLVQSDGRLLGSEAAKQFPVRLVQSGPAAGAEAARLFGELAERDDVLCFDMGGTTAKACFIPDRTPERTARFEVARETRFAEGSGLTLQIPAVDMIEIGAGGGSLARIDERGLLEVGPDSAGADPGPACYGIGNPYPTVTDCDLLLGYLDAESFLGGKMTLDRDAAFTAVETHLAKPLGIDVIAAAWGVCETVTANMAQAATMHAIEKALDVTRFAMLPIGGAGPVHACAMARKMNLTEVICPSGAGVASAIGMLGAAVSFEIARAQPSTLTDVEFSGILGLVEDMSREAEQRVSSAGVLAQDTTRHLSVMMRYIGQGYEIQVPVDASIISDGDRDALGAAFTRAYERRYGRSESVGAEILSWRLLVTGPQPGLAAAYRRAARADATGSGPRSRSTAAVIQKTRPVWFDDAFVETPVFRRFDLEPSDKLSGPAIVEEAESTLVVPPNADLEVDPAGNLIVHV